MFLVKWKGYPEHTWEPEENLLPNAKTAIRDFFRARGQKAPWEKTRSLEHDEQEDNFKALLTRDTTLQVEQVDTNLPVQQSEEATGVYLYASQNTTILPRIWIFVSTWVERAMLLSGRYDF